MPSELENSIPLLPVAEATGYCYAVLSGLGELNPEGMAETLAIR